MRIGIDARLGLSGGIDRYIVRLIEHLARIDRSNRYYIYLSPATCLDRLNLAGSGNFVLVPLERGWYNPLAPLSLSLKIKSDRLDVFHALSYWMVPLFHRCPLVTTVHDTLALEGKVNSLAGGIYGRIANTFAVMRSAAIITVSDYTRQMLLRYFPSCKDKVTTVYHGIGPEFRPQVPDDMERVLRRHGIARRGYLLYVGSLKSNKNIDRLLKAYARLPSRLRDEHPLVCVGGTADDRILALLNGCALRVGSDVHFIPFVEQESTLLSFYLGARALIMPSVAEYFGFPLAEAMACDIPVTSSNSSCLPEVGGDAALYFDPHSTAEMAASIERILTDEPLRARAIAGGRENVKRFVWTETAREVLGIYERLA